MRAHARVVVDQEHAAFQGAPATGRNTEKQLPLPPPWALDRDEAAVIFHDPVHHGEPEPSGPLRGLSC